jgi:hypothetical protein
MDSIFAIVDVAQLSMKHRNFIKIKITLIVKIYGKRY